MRSQSSEHSALATNMIFRDRCRSLSKPCTVCAELRDGILRWFFTRHLRGPILHERWGALNYVVPHGDSCRTLYFLRMIIALSCSYRQNRNHTIAAKQPNGAINGDW